MRGLLFRFQNVAVTVVKPGFALIFLATVLDKLLQGGFLVKTLAICCSKYGSGFVVLYMMTVFCAESP